MVRYKNFETKSAYEVSDHESVAQIHNMKYADSS